VEGEGVDESVVGMEEGEGIELGTSGSPAI